jgi:hypothetical protein
MPGLGDSEGAGGAAPSQALSVDDAQTEMRDAFPESATASEMEEQDIPELIWNLLSKRPSRWRCALVRSALDSVFCKIKSVRLRDAGICNSLCPALSALVAVPSSASARGAALRAAFERWTLVREVRSRALIAEEAKQLSLTNTSLEQRYDAAYLM